MTARPELRPRRVTAAASPEPPALHSRGVAAFGGVVTVAAALAVGELAAGLLPGAVSPLSSIGQVVVNLQPPGAKDLVVSLFGTADKLALQTLILLVALAIGGGLGVLAARGGRTVAVGVIAAFAGAGFVASLPDPNATPAIAALTALIQVIVASWVLGYVLPAQATPTASEAGAPAAPAAPGAPGAPAGRAAPAAPATTRRRVKARTASSMPDWSRRTLLQRGAAVGIGSIAIGAVGRWLLERQRSAPVADLPGVPIPATLPAGADVSTTDLAKAGFTPIVVPNDDFYRIDTALVVPDVDRATWKLTIKGLVDRQVVITWDELVQLPIVEQYTTIACVSNEVGGNLVGNALWRGVPLRTVLAMAGVQAGADELVARAVDGFTVGMPVAWVMDESRTPLVVFGMNGQPLPRNHGYPVRLIVPGLYGYVSATKWLTELELTTFDRFDAYWVDLGWAQQAPILTQSRIDTPRGTWNAGRTAIAGVAWAPDRGISRVEVSIDGQWQDAKLSPPISKATWVQWLVDWNARPGLHHLMVRATDGRGEVQTDAVSPPFPDGARGYHRVDVLVH